MRLVIGGKSQQTRRRAQQRQPAARQDSNGIDRARMATAHSYRIAKVTGKTLRPVIVRVVNRKSHLMTEGWRDYFHRLAKN